MKKFIPPLFVLTGLVGMAMVHFFFTPHIVIPLPWNLLGIFIILIGLMMGMWVGRYFKKIDTQIHTFKEPRKLVTSGLFHYSRNPIYLGFAIVLTGFAFLFGNLISFLFPLLFIIVANVWYIPFEEAALAKAFGKEYLDSIPGQKVDLTSWCSKNAFPIKYKICASYPTPKSSPPLNSRLVSFTQNVY
jgi:protein-S-isoprenylcysteine O-methyltransferase Ste14